MSAVNLPIIEVDYYNCMWNKRVLTPQGSMQTGNATVPGSTGVAARYGTWPMNDVYANPMSTTYTAALIPPFNGSNINASRVKENFYIEEMYLRGGFNDASMSYGVRAYLDEEEPLQQHRFNALIYSGIYNSRTGINRTNEYAVGTNITKAANPQYGSIQKIYAEENNLIVLQENKCSRALIDKSAIYNAEGGGNVTTTNQVIGEIVPYTGEYGISKNPESFAIYAFRKYFVDRNRNAILRLSHDGITEISEYGMRDYFRDSFAELTDEFEFTQTTIPGIGTTNPANYNQNLLGYNTTVPSAGNAGYSFQYGVMGSKILVEYNNSGDYVDLNIYFQGIQYLSSTNFIVLSRAITPDEQNDITSIKLVTFNRSRVYGGWDAYNKQYVVSIQPNESFTYTQSTTLASQTIPKRSVKYATLGFDEQISGWPSFYTYKPSQIGSLKSNFYTVNSDWWNDNTTIIKPGMYSHYSTAVPHSQFYGINNRAEVSIIANSIPSLQKNFLTVDYEGDSGWQASILTSDRTGFDDKRTLTGTWTGDWVKTIDSGDLIYSYLEGTYDSLGNDGLDANPINQPLGYAGFNRKENRYVANLINKSTPAAGEIIFGDKMTGIKGFYMDVTFSTDVTTDPGGMKELYSIGLNYSVSSL
jgi:hypothetical protein